MNRCAKIGGTKNRRFVPPFFEISAKKLRGVHPLSPARVKGEKATKTVLFGVSGSEGGALGPGPPPVQPIYYKRSDISLDIRQADQLRG